MGSVVVLRDELGAPYSEFQPTGVIYLSLMSIIFFFKVVFLQDFFRFVTYFSFFNLFKKLRLAIYHG